MSNVIPPGDTFEGGSLAPFVSREQKAQLARNKVPFVVVGALPKKRNNFGQDETQFRVNGKFFGGETHILALSHNEIRENQALDVLDRLVGNPGAAIGPLYLQSVRTKGGKTAWSISGQEGDGSVTEAVGESTAAESPKATSEDDEIPF